MTKAATASVVIPTRDAGPEFAMILDVVAKAGAREIVVVDSGSLDGTPQLARERGAHVHEIEPAQFDHGRTRNLGVELSSGDFVAFLSQDARPREPSWLSVLLGPFADPRVAATYARVVPRDDASPLVKRSVASDPAFCADSRDQRIENPADWNFESAHDRRVTCHFNNVASCVRRDLLLETPFPEVEFGEDIAWAQHVMLQGWTIGYRAAAVVVHSHGSDLAGDYRRHRADAALHSALFDQILSRRQIAAICASEVTRDLRTLADASAAQRVSSALYSPLLRGAQALGRLAGSRRGASRAPSEMAAARAPETSSFISLFDADFYCAQRPAGLGETLDPLTHYLEWGDEQGLWPHPLFDPAHYGGQYPELEPRAGKRLAHFAETRIGDLASPHPLIDPGWMISQDEALAERDDNILDYYVARGEHEGRRPHPLFDPVWYRKANPDLAGSSIVLHHYAHHGAREGRAPCALFDARFYQAQCPEVATAGRFAIEHYRWRGDADDLSPHPLFDPAHYAAQFPELERGRAIRLLHYESNTRAGGGDPHPLFSTRWYCECSGQRDDDPRTPIVHYLEEGEASGCRPHPLFDPDFYRERYPRVARSVDCLLVHYVLHGGREGCDPNPLFDSCWYIAHTPALADSSENPLLHYLAHPERRCSPHPFFDAAWYEACHRDVGARGQDPLEYFLVEGARRGDDPHPLFDSARYREVLALDANKVAIFHYLASRAPTGALHEGPATWPLFDFCTQFFVREPSVAEAISADPVRSWFAEPWIRSRGEAGALEIAFVAEASPEVSIVIAVHGPVAYTLACLRSLRAAACETAFEVILVVDGPVEGAEQDPFASLANVRVVRNEVALGFVRACNRGAREARAEGLVFLNNDTLVTDGWLDALVATEADFPNAGIVASRLLRPDGRLQECGGVVFRDATAAHCGAGQDPDAPRFAYAREVDYASAAACLVPRDLFESLDGFDEGFAPAFYEDTDLAFRVRQRGRSVLCQPTSSVIHFGGVSYRRDEEAGQSPLLESNRKVFYDRWSEELSDHEAPGGDVDCAMRRNAAAHILVLDATMLTPKRDSGSLRMFNILRILRRMGCRVTFAPADLRLPAAESHRLRAAGIQVLGPPHVTSIAAYLETHGHNFDLSLVSRPETAARFAPVLREHCPNAPLVYDTVDLHYLRRERELALLGTSQVSDREACQERTACESADRVVVVSDYDRDRLVERLPGIDISVISNVHECRPPKANFAGRSGMLFIGGFRHAPNVDAVRWFVGEVLPRVRAEEPDAVLHVVGSEMPEEISALEMPGVAIEGYVEDPTDLYEACRLSIAPLRYGSGVKGKVNQSMAHGLPCVVTSVAAEGIPAVEGRDLLVADAAPDFAAQVLRLYRDESLWQSLSNVSLDHVEEHFSMDRAETMIRHLLAACGIEL